MRRLKHIDLVVVIVSGRKFHCYTTFVGGQCSDAETIARNYPSKIRTFSLHIAKQRAQSALIALVHVRATIDPSKPRIVLQTGALIQASSGFFEPLSI